MRTHELWCAGLIALSLPASAQLSPTSFATPLRKTIPVTTVLEQGPHHKVIQSLSAITQADGSVATQTNTYTLLETGLSYLNAQGQWQDAVAAFDGHERAPRYGACRPTGHRPVVRDHSCSCAGGRP